jgi:hypothetical protein
MFFHYKARGYHVTDSAVDREFESVADVLAYLRRRRWSEETQAQPATFTTRPAESREPRSAKG